VTFGYPFPCHVKVPLAIAEVGKMAHAIMRSVAAVTAMRPAAVSRLLWFVLRCAGIFSYLHRVDRLSNWGTPLSAAGDSRTPIRATSSAEGPRLP
jgi:hypothetical protein